MILKSYAKVNLHLDIIKKRSDGYHDLESIFLKIALHDNMQIDTIGTGFSLKYSRAVEWAVEDDILYKTYHKYCLATNLKPNISIIIDKQIPNQAGLGGSSSNSATLLNYLYKNYVKPQNYLELESSIGADVPFFMQENNACLIEGIGNIITPLSNKSYNLVLVKPSFGISTKEAFAKFSQSKLASLGKNNIVSFFNSGDINRFHNHFTMILTKEYPAIALIKQELLNSGADYAELSGSGSVVVGYFKDNIDNTDLLKNKLASLGKVYISKTL